MKTIIPLLVLILCAIPVLGIEVSVNNYDPSPAEAGKFVNVWFKVENPTDTKTNEISITLTPQDGLKLTSGEEETKRVGILGTFISELVQYRLEVEDGAIEGPNMVKISVQETGRTSEIEFELPIEVVEKDFKEVDLQIGDIRSDPTRIKPDDDSVKLDIVLQNLGDTTARGVRARLDNLPSGITFTESYSDLELLGNIDGDGSVTGTYLIDVDEEVTPAEYTARLYIDYKYKEDEDEDDYLDESIVLPVRIPIKAVPLYNITHIAFEPSQLRAGDKDVKMKLTVQNTGQEEGESVRIKVYGKSEQPFDYDVSSNFVAPSLKPGEQAEVTLEFDIDKTAIVQPYILDLEIKNLINDDVVTYDKTAIVDVALPAKGTPIGLLGAVGVIILIAAVVVFKRNRKNSKKKTPKKIKLE